MWARLCRLFSLADACRIEAIQHGEDVLRGTKLTVDTSGIRHRDIWTAANGMDKLKAASIFSTNELRRKFGEPRIDEEWADQHVLTKNYEAIEEGKTE